MSELKYPSFVCPACSYPLENVRPSKWEVFDGVNVRLPCKCTVRSVYMVGRIMDMVEEDVFFTNSSLSKLNRFFLRHRTNIMNDAELDEMGEYHYQARKDMDACVRSLGVYAEAIMHLVGQMNKEVHESVPLDAVESSDE